MGVLSGKLFKGVAALAFSFVASGSAPALANDDGVEDNISFTCKEPDKSKWKSKRDALKHAFSATVFIKPESINNLGTGFFINNDGYIVTNAHVIAGKEGKISLYDENGRNFKGEKLPYTIIGTDKNTDIAVIKVEMDKPNNCLVINPVAAVDYQDNVVAIGHPFGRAFTLTGGIVSMPKRTELRYTDHIQTDVAMNGGNSGGPLLNEDYKLIGVNTLLISIASQNAGVNYSIPNSTTQKIADNIIKYGEVPYSFSGLSTRSLREENKGAKVTKIDEYGPAYYAGLQKDDYIVQVGQTKITDDIDLTRALAWAEKETRIPLIVMRGDGEIKLQITPEGKADYDERVALIKEEKNKIRPHSVAALTQN